MILQTNNNAGARSPIRKIAATTFGRLPGRFTIARALGPSYALRCAVFHDVSASESPFTRGMGVSTTPADLEAALKFLSQHYTFVSLQDVLADSDGGELPSRAAMVTFDDGYASVMDLAVPLCRRFGIPAIFFLNAAYLDNHRLAPDNIVCFVGNRLGLETIQVAVREVKGADGPKLTCVAEVFSRFFPAISLAERQAFLDALLRLAGIDERELAKEARLYLTRKQVAELASLGFEIGNHTYSHVRCRSMLPREFGNEIDKNKSELEALAGREVRSFSVPYGSTADLRPELWSHLKQSGHHAAFLSESVANQRSTDPFHLDRVSLRAGTENLLFLELEVMPRLRAIRNWLRSPGRHASIHRTPAPADAGLNAQAEIARGNQN